jgi:uncharacterized membrane protein YsdA (DUF1294 family)
MRSAHRSRGKDPWFVYGLVAFVIAITLAVVLYWFVDILGPLRSWLVAITIVTFLAYGYDKVASQARRTRVPESVLLALAFAGGTVGAVVGMLVFRHKTAKRSFQLRLFLIAVLQLVLIVLLLTVVGPRLG